MVHTNCQDKKASELQIFITVINIFRKWLSVLCDFWGREV